MTVKLNLGCGDHQLAGFANLDKPWHIQDGLDYETGSVDAITVSHMFLYVPLPDWPVALAECFRVLKPGGVLRVTEDNTEDPDSERYGGWHDAITLTGPKMIRAALKEAGFIPRKMHEGQSLYRDLSLCQAWHGDEPKVCFFEGAKPK
jgi:SAM-dependent methyltransferase